VQVFSQVEPDILCMMTDGIQQPVFVLSGKEAQVDFGIGQIPGYMDFRDRDQGRFVKNLSVSLKHGTEIFLDHPGYFLLSCRFHGAKIWEKVHKCLP